MQTFFLTVISASRRIDSHFCVLIVVGSWLFTIQLLGLLVNRFGVVLLRVGSLDGGIDLLHPILSIFSGLREEDKTLTASMQSEALSDLGKHWHT